MAGMTKEDLDRALANQAARTGGTPDDSGNVDPEERKRARGDYNVATPPEGEPPKEEPKEAPKEEPKKAEKPKEEPPKEEQKKDDDDNQPFIPKRRLDVKNQKIRQLEQEQKELRARLAQAEANAQALASRAPEPKDDGPSLEDAIADAEGELEKLNEQLYDAIADGKKAEATKLQREVNKLNRAIAHAERDLEAPPAADPIDVPAAVQYELAVQYAEDNVPALDSSSDEYDKELRDSVKEMERAFVTMGRPKVEALALALDYYVGDEMKKAAGDEDAQAAARARMNKQAAERAKKADAAGDFDKGSGKVSSEKGMTGQAPAGTKLSYSDLQTLKRNNPQAFKQARGDYLT